VTPRISVCLPTLNSLSFLRERFDSIFQQSFQDWELFVYDSHSDDWSWEFIQEVAAGDKRVRTMQGPREGPYPAWNECVRQSRGELIYIATSDDSMAPDFLEKMEGALEEHPECDLAHCPLIIVDSAGEKLTDRTWQRCTVFADGIEQYVDIPHVRSAPHDGLLQLTGRHTFLSITQLLIRRSLFSKIGTFSDRWGSVSDFNWEMKAGLVANTVHVPDTWATWRVHPKQLTASMNIYTREHFQKFEDMIENAISDCMSQLPAAVATTLRSQLVDQSKEMRSYYETLRESHDSPARRRVFQLTQMCFGTMNVRREIVGRLFGKTRWTDRVPAEIRDWLESRGLQPIIDCSHLRESVAVPPEQRVNA